MTYLPPESGVPGGQPWPQQSPPGAGYPQGYPPQGPGYAPQYPQYPQYQQPAGYPQPGYGYPPAGYGYDPQQPPNFGYQPQQPAGFGYPGPAYPPPKSGGSGKWWLIGGVVTVVAVLGLVLTVVLTASSDGNGQTASGRSSSVASSDEDQIRSLMTAPAGDPAELQQRFCQNDQEVFDKLGGLGALDVPGGADGKPTGEVSITDIKVTGNKATAKVTMSGSGNIGLPDSTIYFRKESGEWKLCMTDSPALAGLPGRGGR
jgi:hypothetical protein